MVHGFNVDYDKLFIGNFVIDIDWEINAVIDNNGCHEFHLVPAYLKFINVKGLKINMVNPYEKSNTIVINPFMIEDYIVEVFNDNTLKFLIVFAGDEGNIEILAEKCLLEIPDGYLSNDELYLNTKQRKIFRMKHSL